LKKGRRSTRPKGEDDEYKGNNSDNNSFVDFNGDYFKIKNAKLYTPPSSEKIPLYMAAVGEKATKAAAKHTDDLITVTKPNKSRYSRYSTKLQTRKEKTQL